MKTRIIATLAAALLAGCGGDAPAPQGANQSGASGNEPAAQTQSTIDQGTSQVAQTETQSAQRSPAAEASAASGQAASATAEGESGAAASQLAAAQTLAESSRFEAGQHYRRLSPQQPISTDSGQIEVAEIFMYSCPGCYGIAPHMEQWKENKPDYVNLVRIPALFHRVAIMHAQAFYTAEALGKIDEMHTAFFTEFHVNNNALDSEDSLRRFFARFGVSEQDFNGAWNSVGVRTRMARARDLAGRYSVGETPTVVVHGKYVITGGMAGTYQTWFEIIEALAAREYAAASSE